MSVSLVSVYPSNHGYLGAVCKHRTVFMTRISIHKQWNHILFAIGLFCKFYSIYLQNKLINISIVRPQKLLRASDKLFYIKLAEKSEE